LSSRYLVANSQKFDDSANNSPTNSSAPAPPTSGSHNAEMSCRCISSRVPKKRNSDFVGMNLFKGLDTNMKELHDVCKSIIDKFIVDGAVQQINIPGKMRIDVERMFKEWVNTPGANNPIPLKQINPDAEKPNPNSESYRDFNLTFDANSFIKVKEIFKRSKKEVYELLKKDTFVRLKMTEEFLSLIQAIRNPKKDKTSNRITTSQKQEQKDLL